MRRSGLATASRCLVYFGERGDLLQAGLGPDFRVLWRSPTDFGRPDVLSFASVRDLAHAYMESLMPLLGRAPSAVVGFSYGGVLGLEVASQLAQAGRAVAELILVDPDADACCGTFYRSRSRALGAENGVDLVTAHEFLILLADLRSGRWRILRSKAANVARRAAQKFSNLVVHVKSGRWRVLRSKATMLARRRLEHGRGGALGRMATWNFGGGRSDANAWPTTRAMWHPPSRAGLRCFSALERMMTKLNWTRT